MQNRQQMASALRGSVPAGGGMIAAPTISTTPEQYASGASDAMGGEGMESLMEQLGKYFATNPSVAGAGVKYGPEVDKMGGTVTARL